MPIKTTATTVRPDTSAPFFTYSESEKNHVTTTYENTGKMTRNTERSEDKLTRVVERVFATEADFEQFKADPALAAAKTNRTAYNAEKGHTFTFNVELI